MSVFAHKSDKGKFDLGNEADLTGIGDETAFGAIKEINTDLTGKASINDSSTTSTTATWSASKINSSLPKKTEYSTDVYVYGKVCTVFLHGDKTSYSIPTPAKNQYMACRTVNINNATFGDAYLSYSGNASFVGQTGNSVFGVITYIIA